MQDELRLERILGRIYAEPGGPAGWPSILEDLTDYVGGQFSQLMIGDPRSERPEVSALCRRDPDGFAAYLAEYGPRDPRQNLLLAQAGRGVFRDDAIEPEGFDEHPMVRDWLDRHGARRSVGSVFASDGRTYANVAVLRDRAEGPFDDCSVERLAIISRHLARALHLSRAGSGSAKPARDSFESSTTPMLLINGEGKLLKTNAAGEILVLAGKLLRSDALGRLRTRGVSDQPTLQRAIKRAGRGFDATILLSDHALARLCPLPFLHPWTELSGPGCILIAIDPPPSTLSSLAADLQTAFGLTAAEARTAALVAAGSTPAEAAELASVALPTVRTQLAAAYAKTGARGQADLARLAQRMNHIRIS